MTDRDAPGPPAAERGRAGDRARPLRPGAQPVPDDAGRHQHLDRCAEPDSAAGGRHRPGPLDEGHLRGVVATAEHGKRVALTLLTHGHADHAEGAARFAELTGTRCAPSIPRCGWATRA